MAKRFATLVASIALVGALFAGVPSSVRASDTIYVAIAGVTYTGVHASDCNDTTHKVDGTDDNVEVNGVFNFAEPEGTFYLCAGTYHFTNEVSQTGDFTIEGGDAATTIIDGGDTTRLFNIDGDFTISNLTLQHGHQLDGAGGAVAATGVILIEDSIFASNYAEGGGGAVASGSVSGASVTVTSSRFSDNSTAGSGGAITTSYAFTTTGSTYSNNTSTAGDDCVGGGGAISAGDDVHATDSAFTGNTAAFGAGTDVSMCFNGSSGNFGGFGGAILTGGLEFVTSSTFTNNKAQLAGGAIAALDFVITPDPVATIVDSSFVGNDLISYVPNFGFALGIGQIGTAVVNASNTPLIIASSTFNSNGHLYGLHSDGFTGCGAVFAGYLEVDSSHFSSNKAPAGSALCSFWAAVTKSSFVGNVADVAGAAMLILYGANVSGSTFVGNSALTGGALFLGDGNIDSNVFTNNVARGGGNNPLGFGDGTGGAMYVDGDATVTNNTFTRNRAQRSGGAVWFVSNAAHALSSMVKNRFVANTSRKAGGAVGYDLADMSAPLPTRSHIAKALRANRFSGNSSARGAEIGGLAVATVR